MKIIIKKEPKVALFENSIVNIYYWQEIDLPKEEIKQMLKDIILVKRKIDFFSDYILEYVNMVFLRDITLEEIFGNEFEETFMIQLVDAVTYWLSLMMMLRNSGRIYVKKRLKRLRKKCEECVQGRLYCLQFKR